MCTDWAGGRRYCSCCSYCSLHGMDDCPPWNSRPDPASAGSGHRRSWLQDSGQSLWGGPSLGPSPGLTEAQVQCTYKVLNSRGLCLGRPNLDLFLEGGEKRGADFYSINGVVAVGLDGAPNMAINRVPNHAASTVLNHNGNIRQLRPYFNWSGTLSAQLSDARARVLVGRDTLHRARPGYGPPQILDRSKTIQFRP